MLVWLTGLISCAPRMASVKEDSGLPIIKDIQVTEMPSKVEIRVFSDFPLLYTTFQLTDPDRLVVDLAGIDFGRFKSTINVQQSDVLEIRPIPAKKPNDVGSLEILLAKPLESNIRVKDGVLFIDLLKEKKLDLEMASKGRDLGNETPPFLDPKMEKGTKGEPFSEILEPVVEVPVQPMVASEPIKKSLPPATQVTKVEAVSDTDGVKVLIEGNGELKQESFLIEGKRLVVDLPGTTSLLETHLLPGVGPTLNRIRVGQHLNPKKVRVVLDLSEPSPFKVMEEGAVIVVHLASKPSIEEALISVSAKESSAGQAIMLAESVGKENEGAFSGTPTPITGNGNSEIKMENSKELKQKEPSPSLKTEKKISETPKEVSQPKTKDESVKAEGLKKVKNSDDGSTEKKAVKTNKKGKEKVSEGEIIQEKRFIGRKISLDFQDADLTNIIRLIADVSGSNVIVGSDVKGRVTLKLINVPWDQSLDIILKMNGLGQLRDGNIIRIATLANIAKQQKAEGDAKKATIEAEDLVTKIIPVNYAKASSLSPTLKKSLSSRGDIMVSNETNTLIVKDIPQHINEVSELVKILDRQTPQVVIEARVVQANTSFAQDIGVQWGGGYTSTSSAGLNYGVFGGNSGAPINPSTGFAVNLPASGSAGPLGATSFTVGRLGRYNLDLRLSAGETTGETKVISTPRITTLDNKEAKIQQGESIPFETVSQSGTQTQFVDATLNLTVTPQITPDGSIIMKIKVTKNAIGSFRSSITGTPSIDKREVNTEILVKDGETAVIGGIFESTDDDSTAGVPWLNKIPVLGWFFKRESETQTRRELLIFITPTISAVQPAV